MVGGSVVVVFPFHVPWDDDTISDSFAVDMFTLIVISTFDV